MLREHGTKGRINRRVIFFQHYLRETTGLIYKGTSTGIIEHKETCFVGRKGLGAKGRVASDRRVAGSLFNRLKPQWVV